jgi:hypothetical protein
MGGYNTLDPHSQYNSSKPVTVKSLILSVSQQKCNTENQVLQKYNKKCILKYMSRKTKLIIPSTQLQKAKRAGFVHLGFGWELMPQ